MPRSQHVPVIGLTGGIGSGKSEVARILAKAGWVVADSDAVGRAALRDEEIKDTLVKWWGKDILDAAGEVDRGKVARIVFSDPAERRRLEGLTHPWIEARRREQFAAALSPLSPTSSPRPDPGVPGFVIDAPLLLEAGLDRECDAVIFVDAPRNQRLERLKRTRGWDERELDRRESSQMSLDEKRRRADHVVSNDGDLSGLSAQVYAVLNTIMQSGPRKAGPLPPGPRNSHRNQQ